MRKQTSQGKTPNRWIAAKGFAIAIGLGSLVLLLPWATRAQGWTNPLTALFTATSATCVTGLIVVDTGTSFTLFGQIVILALIQLGGLGIMTMGTFLLILTGRRLDMQSEFVLMDTLGHNRVRGLRQLVARAVIYTFLLEAAGASILIHRFLTRYGYPLGKAVYYGVFHAVSAFCNAGFSLYADSLTSFREDPFIVCTVAALIVLGGLGFLVLYNLSTIHFWKQNRLVRGRLTLNSQLVLTVSTFLLLVGWGAYLLLEWSHTLSSMPWPTRLTVSLFHSITPRTAGFNLVDMAQTRPATQFLTMVLMFIGGGPGSTAGGIKTTTLAVLALTVLAMIRGRRETELRQRTIPMKIIRESLTIFLLSLLCVATTYTALLITEQSVWHNPAITPQDLAFETISAFGTVGLSTGITSILSAAGKLCLVITMFLGRLGPMTVALIIGGRDVAQLVRYPEEEIVVG